MDIRMPEMDGTEATQQIVGDAKLNASKVVVLTTFDEDELIQSDFDDLFKILNAFLDKLRSPKTRVWKPQNSFQTHNDSLCVIFS